MGSTSRATCSARTSCERSRTEHSSSAGRLRSASPSHASWSSTGRECCSSGRSCRRSRRVAAELGTRRSRAWRTSRTRRTRRGSAASRRRCSAASTAWFSPQRRFRKVTCSTDRRMNGWPPSRGASGGRSVCYEGSSRCWKLRAARSSTRSRPGLATAGRVVRSMLDALAGRACRDPAADDPPQPDRRRSGARRYRRRPAGCAVIGSSSRRVLLLVLGVRRAGQPGGG